MTRTPTVDTNEQGDLTVVEHIDCAVLARAGGVQVRVQQDDSRTSAYAEQLKLGADFPPGRAYRDADRRLWFSDGRHRLAAHQLAGRASMPVEVLPGTERDALEHAIRANQQHGIGFTIADRRRAVMLLLQRAGDLSDRAIGEVCRVDHKTVAVARRNTGGEIPHLRKGRDGKTYDTDAIAEANRQRAADADAETDPSPPELAAGDEDGSDPDGDREEPDTRAAIAGHTCPRCAAGPGERCVDERGHERSIHPDRLFLGAAPPEAHNREPATLPDTRLEDVPRGTDPAVDAARAMDQAIARDVLRQSRIAEANRLLAVLAPTREELRTVLAQVDPADVRAAVRPEREAGDAYYTRPETAQAIVRHLKKRKLLATTARSWLLEGHVGGGAWTDALLRCGILGSIVRTDLDPTAPGLLDEDGELVGQVGDFLTYDYARTFDVIVGNCPWDEAEQHVRRALDLLRAGGLLAWILRRNWLGAARAPLVAEGLAPCEELILAPRQSFVRPSQPDDKRTTDREEYSVFLWKGGERRFSWTTSVLDVGGGRREG